MFGVHRLLTITAGAALAAAIIGIVIYGRMNAGVLTRQPAKPISASARKPAPQFSGTTLSGADVSLRQYTGRPVVINFFASWCAPCKEEAPGLARLAHEFGSRVQMLGISIDDKQPGAMRFASHYGWSWPILYEPNDNLAFRYGIPGKPTTIIVDQQGRIAWQHAGKIASASVADVLQALL
jgi:cytochrome c biogenesis protein CcmG, thiol:disulfide interchange protein DsbE